MAVSSVVVGVDGSPESEDALVWALEEGRLRDLPVRAVNVWQPSGAPQELERLSALHSVSDLRAHLLQGVASGVRAVVERAHATDVAVTPQVVYGHPARELIREAGTDSLLVVGSRGRGSLAGSMLGSVSQSCAQYANGTVVVVRGRRPGTGAGRVVVGVDGSDRSVRALRFADDAARVPWCFIAGGACVGPALSRIRRTGGDVAAGGHRRVRRTGFGTAAGEHPAWFDRRHAA